MSTFVTDRGHEIFYETFGAGPALMLLTGFMGSGERFHQAGYIDRLQDTYRLIVVDPLGHHRSSKPHDPDDYAPDRSVEYLIGIFDQEHIASAHVLAASFGSRIAAYLAATRPERVDSLVTVGWPTSSWTSDITPIERDIELFGSGRWDDYFKSFPFELPEGLRSQIESWNDPLALTAISQAIIANHAAFGLNPADVPVPQLVVVGDSDPMYESIIGDAATADAPVLVLAGADHIGAFQELDQIIPAMTAIHHSQPL